MNTWPAPLPLKVLATTLHPAQWSGVRPGAEHQIGDLVSGQHRFHPFKEGGNETRATTEDDQLALKPRDLAWPCERETSSETMRLTVIL